MRKVVYLGLDAHVRSCVLAGMDSRGKLLFNERFSTSESALKSQLVAVKAHKKILALEESPTRVGSLERFSAMSMSSSSVIRAQNKDSRKNNLSPRLNRSAGLLLHLLRLDSIIPLWNSFVAFDVQLLHFVSANFDSALVYVFHQCCFNRQSRSRRGGRQVFQHGFYGFEWYTGPVFGHFTEEAMFDRIPFGGSGGIVCDRDREIKRIDESML